MPDCSHAMIAQVTIDSVDSQNVSFWTRSDSKTGDPNERLRRLFTVAVSEVWTAAIPGQPTPVAMQAGASGPLYLSKTGWQTTTPDGYHIFGITSADFKFPSCLAAGSYQDNLTVIPSELVVTGYREGQGGQSEPFQIDLLGPEAAESQDIRWDGAEYLEIRLAANGSQAAPAPGTVNGTIKVWPTRIMVTGSAKSAPKLAGQVDLLDSELAGHAQHIQFDRRGTEISLVLTQDGFGAFHVVPGM